MSGEVTERSIVAFGKVFLAVLFGVGYVWFWMSIEAVVGWLKSL